MQRQHNDGMGLLPQAPAEGPDKEGSLFVSTCAGDTATRLNPAQEGPPMLHPHPSATQQGSATQEESKTRKNQATFSYLSSPVHSIFRSLRVTHWSTQPLVLTWLVLTLGWQHAVPGKQRGSPSSSVRKKKHTAA